VRISTGILRASHDSFLVGRHAAAAVAEIGPSTLADLPPLPANITPVKLVSDFLRCLYNEIMLPTLQDNYGHR
jgi:hypothetical protein